MVMTSLFGKYKSLKDIFLRFPFVVCCASEEILLVQRGMPRSPSCILISCRGAARVPSLTVVPHLAQPPGHSRLYSSIRCSPGPVVVLLVGDVDVDGGVRVLASLLGRWEHPEPGHGGLLIC